TREHYRLVGGGWAQPAGRTASSYGMLGTGFCRFSPTEGTCSVSIHLFDVKAEAVQIDPLLGTASVKFQSGGQRVEARWQRSGPSLDRTPSADVFPVVSTPDPTQFSLLFADATQPANAWG